MELNELQKKAVELTEKIDAKSSGKHDVETTMIHLMEELGEVATQVFNKKMGRKEPNMELLAGELADCVILSTVLANNFGLDIQKEVENKLKTLDEKSQ